MLEQDKAKINKRNKWTSDQDNILATTVIEYVKNGHTQSAACKTVSIIINRPESACRFRWNSTLRKNYEEQLLQAKLVAKTTVNKAIKPNKNDDSNNNRVLIQNYANSLDKHLSTIQALLNTESYSSDYVMGLENEVVELKHKLEEKSKRLNEVTTKYQNLIEVLSNANHLISLEEDKISL